MSAEVLNFICFDFQDPFLKSEEVMERNRSVVSLPTWKNKCNSISKASFPIDTWSVLHDTQKPKENKLFWAHTCSQIYFKSLCKWLIFMNLNTNSTAHLKWSWYRVSPHYCESPLYPHLIITFLKKLHFWFEFLHILLSWKIIKSYY